MPIRAVGFDLDYTLVVPSRSRAALLADAAAAVGAEPIDREAYLQAHGEHLTGETRTPIFETLLPEPAPTERASALAETYRNLVNEAIEPLPGVEAMLADLREDYRVGLLTNGPRRAQRSKLETLGWTDVFDATVVSGDLDAGKPAVGAFEDLCAALEARPAATAFVGDDVEADVAGAAAAGLRPVQVRYDGGPDVDPQAADVVDRDALAARLPDVLASLDP